MGLPAKEKLAQLCPKHALLEMMILYSSSGAQLKAIALLLPGATS